MSFLLIIHKRKASLRKLESLLNDLCPDQEIRTVMNGEEGMKIALADHPMALFIAESLPGIGGLQVIQKLRRTDIGKATPIVFLSEWEPTFEQREQAFISGADLLISEPIVEAEFKAQIKLLLRLLKAECNGSSYTVSHNDAAPQHLAERLFEALPVPLLLLNANLTVVYANRNILAQNLLQSPQPVVPGLHLSEAIPHLSSKHDLLLKAESVAQGQSDYQDLEVTLQQATKQSQDIHFHLYGVALTRNEPKQRHVVLFAEPATRRKALQLQLLQQAKAEAVGRLARGVAHDFNNALMVVQNSAAYLKEKYTHDPDIQRDLDVIQQVTEHACSLTEQLTGLCRQKTIGMESVDLNRLLQSTRTTLSHLLPAHVKLDVQPGKELHPIHADFAQLQQLVMNLVINASDSLRQDGVVTLKAGNVHLNDDFCLQVWNPAGFQAGEYARLQVIDYGSGIAAEVRPNIFDPFFTTKADGTGLGLSQVYSITKVHGGFITVDSCTKQGSVFTIYFPRVRAGQHENNGTAPPTLQRNQASHTATVLVVEDEEQLRRAVVRMLQEWQFRVLQAAEGIEALEMLENGDEKIDLLVTDLVMPRMAGHVLADKLLEKQPGMKIIYVSGYDDAYAPAIASGHQACFLQKPYSKDDLSNALGKLLPAANHHSGPAAGSADTLY